MTQEIFEAEYRFKSGKAGHVVNCPHCEVEWYGWDVQAAARTRKVQTCQNCGKEFKVVEPKKG